MLVVLCYIPLPIVLGVGAALYLDKRRGAKPVDTGPWKLLAGLILLMLVSTIITLSWEGITSPVFANWDEPRTRDNLIGDALFYPAMTGPLIFIGAAITSSFKGVKHPRTFALFSAMMTPILLVSWYILLIVYSCITTGNCL